MVDDKPLLEGRQIVFSVDELVDCGSNSNYFIDHWDILDRNAAFDIVKEVRLERGKSGRSSKVIDKKSVIRGVRSIFKIQGYNENSQSFDRDSGVFL